MAPQIWFITGASSGFGRCMTELVLKKGDIAIATLRKPDMLADLAEQHGKDRLLILKLDVTNAAEVTQAFAQSKAVFGRIDVVFNNAGVLNMGEVEVEDEEDARALFDVNFWGAVHVTKEAVKFFREVNGPPVGGRLLQNSSMFGLYGNAITGYYNAAKHALEGLTKSLVMELNPEWNIKVTLVEPGFFQTNGGATAMVTPLHPAYSTGFSVLARQLVGPNEFPGDTDKAVEVIYKVAQMDAPPTQFPLGLDAINWMRKAANEMLQAIETYGSLSEGLLKEERSEVAETIRQFYTS